MMMMSMNKRGDYGGWTSSSVWWLLGTAALMVASWVWLYRVQEQRKRAGPKGWPLLGNLLEQRRNQHRVLDWVVDYFEQGRVKTWSMRRFGSTQDLFLTVDPVNVEHILATNFKNYGKGGQSAEILEEILGTGIFAADGEQWKRHRKVASSQFSTRKIREFSNTVFREDSLHLVHLLDRAMVAHEPVNFQDLALRMTLDNICQVAFGVEMGCCSSLLPNVALVTNFDGAQVMAIQRSVDPFWRVKRALNMGRERRMREAIHYVNSFAASVIAKRRSDILAAHNAGKEFEKEDLLSKFMAYNNGAKDSYNDKELRDMIISFMLAGRDTTAATISWFVYRMCSLPKVADKIYEEGVQVIGKHESFESAAKCLTHDTLGKMHYLHAAIEESIRFHPPVSRDGKVAKANDVLPDGTRVREGDIVQYCPHAMGRMPFLWGPDVLEFKPERWLKNGVFCAESPFKFTAFQAGPRICLGKDLAYLTVKLTLALTFHFFTFKLVPGQNVTYSESLVTLIRDGLRVTMTPR